MNLGIDSGRYVVAVSGGVDSMALLHMLRSQPGLHLVVAHFDHGMRPDSHLDRQLVEETAARHDLPLVAERGELGETASEADARTARYDFLHRVRHRHRARAVMTAHHQDDLLETAMINLLRGTSRRGLSAMMNSRHVIRPLLQLRKRDLVAYARANGIGWREDSTNADGRYLRNRIRHNLLPTLTPQDRRTLLGLIGHLQRVNGEIDRRLARMLDAEPAAGTIRRRDFIMLPHPLARELLAAWLRRHGVRGYDRRMLERLAIAAKTYFPGRRTDINKDWFMGVYKDRLALVPRDR